MAKFKWRMDGYNMKGNIKKVGKKGLGLFGEFKQFIARGNVLDLAIGVVIGGAFGKIVTSLVDNITNQSPTTGSDDTKCYRGDNIMFFMCHHKHLQT